MDSDGDAVKLTEEITTAQTLPDKTTCPLDSSNDNKEREDESEKIIDPEINEINPSNALNAERIFDKDPSIETESIIPCTNSLIEPFQPLCEDINSSESETDTVLDRVLTNPRKFKIIKHDHSDEQTAKGAAGINDKTESDLEKSQEKVSAESEIHEAENNVLAHTPQETANDTSEKSSVATKNADPPDKINLFSHQTNNDSGNSPYCEPVINEKVVETNVDVGLTIEGSPNHVENVPYSLPNSDIEKTQDHSQRNVFDAFPVEELNADETSRKTELLSKSKHELDESLECELDSMKLRQFSERSKASKNSDFLSSFESFLKSQQPSQQLLTSKTLLSGTNSVPIVHSPPKQAVETLKQSQEGQISYTSKKGKSLASDFTSLTENVKKKFPKLKELRVSLDSKEVLVHTNSFMFKDNKMSTKKLGKDMSCKTKKVKEVGSDSEIKETQISNVDDVASVIVSKENDKDEMSDIFMEKCSSIPSDTLTITKQNFEVPAVSHHIFDSESAKPLKKRSRRGKRFEYLDKVNVGECDKIPADSLTGKAADCENQHVKIIDTVDVNVVENVVKDTSLEPSTDGVQSVSEVKSSEFVNLVEPNCNNEILAPSFGTYSVKSESKSKRKKRKTKRSNRHSKKYENKNQGKNPIAVETDSEVNNEMEKSIDANNKNINTSKAVKLAIKRSVLHRKCTIVKKYPERTCSKVNKLESEIKAEKKPFPKSKVKLIQKSKPLFKELLQAPAEDKDLSQTGDSVKPKKKRRRKVKPWSWGNEKKKYKPKIKLLPVVCSSMSPVSLQELEDTIDVLKSDNIKQNSEIQSDQLGNQNEVTAESETGAKLSLERVEITDINNEIERFETSDTNCMNQFQIESNSVPLTSDSIEKLPKKSNKRTGSRKHSKSRKRKKLCLTADQKEVNHFPATTSEMNSQEKLPDIDENSEMEMKYKLISEPSVSSICSEPSVNGNIEQDRLCEEPLPESTSQSTNCKRSLKKGKRHKKGRKGSVKECQIHKEQTSATKFNSDKAKDCMASELKVSSYQESSRNEMEKLNEEESTPGAQNLDQQQQQDNEPRLDTAHVSTDSGIESVAGSPVGNESPNSVLSSEVPHSIAYHPTAVQFSTKNNNKSVFADSIFGTISSSVLLTCSSSATTSTDSFVKNLDLSNTTGKSVCTTTSSLVSSVCFPSVCESKTLTDDKDVNFAPELLSDKLSNSTEMLKEPNVGSVSPSKKKNRAKFLQHFKTSVLLQQGRMPTESEKEQMLEDKFSYLNKVKGHESKEGAITNDTVLFKPNTGESTCSSDTSSKSDKFNHEFEENTASDEPIPNKLLDNINIQSLVNATENRANDAVDALTIEQETNPNTRRSTDSCNSSEIAIKSASAEDTVELSETFSSELDTGLSDNGPEHSFGNELDSELFAENSISTQSNLIDANNESLIENSASSEINTEKDSAHYFQKDNSEKDLPNLEMQNDSGENTEGDTKLLQDIEKTTEELDAFQNNDDVMNNECILSSQEFVKHSLNEENIDTSHIRKFEMPIDHSKSSQDNIMCDKRDFTASIPDFHTCQILQQSEFSEKVENTDQIKPLKKRGRPPGKKSILLKVKKKLGKTFNVKQKVVESFKIKKKLGRPPKKIVTVSVKRKPGRPKGSKNKSKHVSVINKQLSEIGDDSQSIKKVKKNKPGRPKGSVNKPKLISANTDADVRTESHSSFSLMQWRESKEQTGLELKKRKPGRPRKNPISTDFVAKTKARLQKKNGEYNLSDASILRDPYHHHNQYVSRHIENNINVDSQAALDSVFNFPQSDNFNKTDLLVSEAIEEDLTTSPHIRISKLHISGKKSYHKSKKSKGHSKLKSYGTGPDLTEMDLTQDYDFNAEDIEMPNLLESPHAFGVPAEVYSAFGGGSVPPQSDRSIDSDTSGAGSSLGAKSNFQFMFDFSKHKRKKTKKKLLYFKTKHKNIIDPVYVGEVDCLIRDFPSLSISAPEETYIKVRPGEVPLPSIFKVSIINVKKKKKDKLSVFEKSRPLKHKNLYESDLRERVKLGRRKGIDDNLFETFSTDLEDLQDSQYLPPKKRHKLFSALDTDRPRSHVSQKSQEKRKVGRPKKVQPPSPAQLFSFGADNSHASKMGHDDEETMVTFASVAAMSQKQVTPSPTRTMGNTSLFETEASLKEKNCSILDVDKRPAQTHRENIFESFEPNRLLEERHDHIETNDSKSNDTAVDNVETSESISHDRTVESAVVSCDSCKQLQTSSNIDESCDSPAPRSPHSFVGLLTKKLLTKSYKHLKRKLRKGKSKKFTRLKKSKPQASKLIKQTEEYSESSAQVFDFDSSVRSVCSESEPLPTFNHRKRQNSDSDSDWGDIVTKKRKIRPPTPSRSTSDVSQDSDSSIVKKQPGTAFQKKKYQKAGLYSDAYKDEEKTKDGQCVNQVTVDLPLHFGNHVFKKDHDFQLPYDVWWLHFNDMLPKKGDGQQYRRIRNNLYYDARPVCRYEAHACNCKPPANPAEKGCGEECLNRMIYTECSPDLCSCADQCSNQRIQKHQFAPGLQKFLTKDRGFGVKTTKAVKAGDLIMEYLGEVVSVTEFQRRMTEEYSQECHHYCLNLDSGTVIDGYRMGNIARFVNHSCQPNCEMQKWNVNGTYHMCLFAMADIPPGTELGYDYNFHSFNEDSQQLCKCGSDGCRGIIGGRKQWRTVEKIQPVKLKGRPAKDKRKSKHRHNKFKETMKKKKLEREASSSSSSSSQEPAVLPANNLPRYMMPLPYKPITKKERHYVRHHSIFLVRNLDRIEDMKQRGETRDHNKTDDNNKGMAVSKRDVFVTQLMALNTYRSMKTRRLTLADEDPELGKMAKLAQVCKEIYSSLSSCKDDEGNLLASELFHLPSRKKHPLYYQMIDQPIDLKTIENKIFSAEYENIESFEHDVMLLFHNVEKYCGKKSGLGHNVKQLRMVYNAAKRDGMTQLYELIGEERLCQNSKDTDGLTLPEETDSAIEGVGDTDMNAPTPSTSAGSESDISELSESKADSVQDEEEEEIIRCICGIYRDEGLMIQCEKCFVWQHTDCMLVKGDEENYMCEQCYPRPVDREVKFSTHDTEGEKDGLSYYMTLMRDDMQIRVWSCVYVLKEVHARRYSYKKTGNFKRDKMDIFRIERLWKNDNGEKFAFGHMYVRPHETFHEPSRKFYPNEVFRTPLYEVVPLESITGYCCVLDPLTYCKGRPKGYRDDDIYICEYRMDKTLHLFYKISPKQRVAVNTKSYCFDMYENKLNPKRTYIPHEVPESYKRNSREKSVTASEEGCAGGSREKKVDSDSEEDVPLVRVKEERRKEKREHVNKILDSLSNGKISPSKKRHDLTYLLSGERKT